MTVADKIKILDDKIKSNQPQYDWGREAAKISALSSRDLLEKYKYLTGEDLGHKPSVIRKAKFEYYPLGMTMKKGIKATNNASKPVNSNIGSIYGCYNFVEFKRDAEKLKKYHHLIQKIMK